MYFHGLKKIEPNMKFWRMDLFCEFGPIVQYRQSLSGKVRLDIVAVGTWN